MGVSSQAGRSGHVALGHVDSYVGGHKKSHQEFQGDRWGKMEARRFHEPLLAAWRWP